MKWRKQHTESNGIFRCHTHTSSSVFYLDFIFLTFFFCTLHHFLPIAISFFFFKQKIASKAVHCKQILPNVDSIHSITYTYICLVIIPTLISLSTLKYLSACFERFFSVLVICHFTRMSVAFTNYLNLLKKKKIASPVRIKKTRIFFGYKAKAKWHHVIISSFQARLSKSKFKFIQNVFVMKISTFLSQVWWAHQSTNKYSNSLWTNLTNTTHDLWNLFTQQPIKLSLRYSPSSKTQFLSSTSSSFSSSSDNSA